MAGNGLFPKTLSNVIAKGQGSAMLTPAAKKVKISEKTASFLYGRT
jgi:hypothetical protein